ncbi:MAG: TIGR03557 family F420-dependent LLM class oxidoreductase [Myxococcales bacterium]|nr:MAG: TIGR03557 family F420-dependent LLM class oxidoreductase [Myxococcales bacterium]
MATRPSIAWQASHEQFPPEELVRFAVLAERCGFDAVHSSDHLVPWSERQGHSGFSFAWLGAAMQATQLPFGVICAAGYRYHPAIVAQAAATLARLFPGRFTLSLGSGEALNEHITGEPWPSKNERNARLHECADVVRRLLAGEHVDHRGRVVVADVKLHSLPDAALPLFAAALSPQTAKEVAVWADGLLTLLGPDLPATLQAFRENGGAGKPVHVKVDVCYGRDLAAAKQDAWQQWRTVVLPREELASARSVAELEARARAVTPEQVAEKVIISAEPARFAQEAARLAAMDVSSVIFHQVGRDQETFIRDCAEALIAVNRMLT